MDSVEGSFRVSRRDLQGFGTRGNFEYFGLGFDSMASTACRILGLQGILAWGFRVERDRDRGERERVTPTPFSNGLGFNVGT